MRYFISNDLEPIAYFIYMVAVWLVYNRYKLLRHKALFFYYVGAAALLYTGLAIKTIYNTWSYNLLFFASICVLSWYFYMLVSGSVKKRIIAACCLFNILLFIAVDVIQGKFLTTFNSHVYSISFITVVLFTLLYLHQILADIQEGNLLLNFDFWLVSGYLLYFLGSFVIVLFYENVELTQRADIWEMQNVILFICSLITLTASLKIIKSKN